MRPGRVYRTRELRRWSANPTRLARRLVREGRLEELAHGLFVRPRQGRFGPAPPADEETLRGFLEGAPFLITGPERWNALGLGSTAVFAAPLVYNTKRSGTFTFGGRRFLLRRVAFPARPSAEWFAVDLLEHHDMVGLSLEVLEGALARAVAEGRFDRERLLAMARRYGKRATHALVVRVVGASAPA